MLALNDAAKFEFQLLVLFAHATLLAWASCFAYHVCQFLVRATCRQELVSSIETKQQCDLVGVFWFCVTGLKPLLTDDGRNHRHRHLANDGAEFTHELVALVIELKECERKFLTHDVVLVQDD